MQWSEAMKTLAFSLICLSLFGSFPASALTQCEEPNFANLSRSVVRIRLWNEKPSEDGIIRGYGGTAWFLDPTHLVTVEHVIEDMFHDGWRDIEIGFAGVVDEPMNDRKMFPFRTRLVAYVPTGATEHLAVLELPFPVSGTLPVKRRMKPLTNKEPIIGLGYPNGILRHVYGKYHTPPVKTDAEPSDQKPQDLMLFEVWGDKGNPPDRLVFGKGASGAPFFDCDGELVGVNVIQITQELDMGLGSIGQEALTTSTAWGEANQFGLQPNQLPRSFNE